MRISILLIGVLPFQEESRLIIAVTSLDNTVNVLDVVILVNSTLGN